MDEMREMLDRAYTDTLQAVADARTGSEEAKWQLQKLTELHKQRMSVKQSEDESSARYEELRMKEEQLKDGKKDRIIKVVLDGAGIMPFTTATLHCWLLNRWSECHTIPAHGKEGEDL